MNVNKVLTNNTRILNESRDCSVLMENDDLKEKKANREAKIVSNLNKSSSLIGSPLLGSRKLLKSSYMSNGLSHEQLKEIYSSCIRLSSENKINIKNAFGLQLIDYMQDLLTSENKSGTNSTNFQVAGCTLDASVKIYSYRVDSVHSDAMKIAGTLGSDQIDENNENIDNFNTSHDDDDILNIKKKKLRKKRFYKLGSSKIEKNLKNINFELFSENILDKNFDSYSNNFFVLGQIDSNPIMSLLLNNFGSSSDKGCYSIDSSNSVFSNNNELVWNDLNINYENGLIDIISDLFDDCNKFTNLLGAVDQFHFLNWTKPNLKNQNSIIENINILTGIVDNDTDRSAIEKQRKTLLQSVLIDTVHAMDETLNQDQSGLTSDHDNTILQNQNINTNNSVIDDLPIFPQQASAIEFEFPNKTEAVVSKNYTNSSVPLNMTGGVTIELSLEPGEYSYFKNLNKTHKNISQIPNMWMGPEHWKHMTNTSIKGADSAIDFKTPNNKVKTQRKRKQLNSESNCDNVNDENVDFMEPLSLDLQKLLKTGKASSTFSKTVVSKTNSDNINLPQIDSVNMQPLFQLFLMPNIKLSQTFHNGNDDVPIITLQDKQIYNYDNDYDRLNYCSGLIDEQSDIQQYNDDENSCNLSPFKPSLKPTFFQDDKGGILTTGTLSQKNKIEYAKFAKRFDTRQIKTSIWKILNNENDKKENIIKDENINNTTFSTVYNNLINDLPSKSAENVSVPIALVCLLHLANEKNLSLEGNEQMNNIQISVKK